MVVLDTSFLIDLLRGHPPAVALLDALEEAGEHQTTPAPAVFELAIELGRSRTPPARAKRLQAALEELHVAPFDEATAIEAGRLAGRLEDAGTPIDDIDCMIAATALRLGERVVTANRKHFDRVPDLAIEGY